MGAVIKPNRSQRAFASPKSANKRVTAPEQTKKKMNGVASPACAQKLRHASERIRGFVLDAVLGLLGEGSVVGMIQ